LLKKKKMMYQNSLTQSIWGFNFKGKKVRNFLYINIINKSQTASIIYIYIYIYLREFQYMVFVPDNSTLSSDQDTN